MSSMLGDSDAIVYDYLKDMFVHYWLKNKRNLVVIVKLKYQQNCVELLKYDISVFFIVMLHILFFLICWSHFQEIC